MNSKILFVFLICFCLEAEAQKLLGGVLPLSHSEVVYQKVIEVIGEPKLNLQNKALDWFDQTGISVTENKPLDATHHMISGSFTFKALWGPNDFKELYKNVDCRVTLILRNERYQYEFSDFTVRTPQQSVQLEIYQADTRLRKYNKAFYKRIDQQVRLLIDKLIPAMAK
jgi:hypothetical protein